MTDREQMELAALAAGAKMTDYSDRTPDHWVIQGSDGVWREWKPREDDGDALRLAARLEIDVTFRVVTQLRVEALAPGGPRIVEYYDRAEDRLPKARLAIFRAAVEIGRDMQESAALGGA